MDVIGFTTLEMKIMKRYSLLTALCTLMMTILITVAHAEIVFTEEAVEAEDRPHQFHQPTSAAEGGNRAQGSVPLDSIWVVETASIDALEEQIVVKP